MSTRIIKQTIVKTKNEWKGKIKLSNKSVVEFVINDETWQQWGAPTSDLYITIPVVEKLFNQFINEL
ncbi:MAG TPA: hypothetical protein VFC79_06425 [Tissierellaceae bacterium]|nr:hypothetical protein [Tissierellaceae bacterium]